MTLQQHDPRQNHLLAALSEEEYQRLLPNLERVDLTLNAALVPSEQTVQHVYFPTDSIISLQCEMEDGNLSEVAVIGPEGIVGISLFMGGETTPSRAVVQSGGEAYRLKGQWLTDEFYRAGPLQSMLLRYTKALIAQMAQTAVCNRHHSLDEQLCRRLLLSLDRLPISGSLMTQALIANMLGAPRERVTEAADKLQKAGLIAYDRGQITVLNRLGLEARVCECYETVKQEYERLLPYSRTG